MYPAAGSGCVWTLKFAEWLHDNRDSVVTIIMLGDDKTTFDHIVNEEISSGARPLYPWEERLVLDWLNVTLNRWRPGAAYPFAMKGFCVGELCKPGRPWKIDLLFHAEGGTRGVLDKYTPIETVGPGPAVIADVWKRWAAPSSGPGPDEPTDDFYPTLRRQQAGLSIRIRQRQEAQAGWW